MSWRYEIRDADNRLVEMQRGFATQKRAQEAGERAARLVQDIRRGEKLKVVTRDGSK